MNGGHNRIGISQDRSVHSSAWSISTENRKEPYFGWTELSDTHPPLMQVSGIEFGGDQLVNVVGERPEENHNHDDNGQGDNGAKIDDILSGESNEQDESASEEHLQGASDARSQETRFVDGRSVASTG